MSASSGLCLARIAHPSFKVTQSQRFYVMVVQSEQPSTIKAKQQNMYLRPNDK